MDDWNVFFPLFQSSSSRVCHFKITEFIHVRLIDWFDRWPMTMIECTLHTLKLQSKVLMLLDWIKIFHWAFQSVYSDQERTSAKANAAHNISCSAAQTYCANGMARNLYTTKTKQCLREIVLYCFGLSRFQFPSTTIQRKLSRYFATLKTNAMRMSKYSGLASTIPAFKV